MAMRSPARPGAVLKSLRYPVHLARAKGHAHTLPPYLRAASARPFGSSSSASQDKTAISSSPPFTTGAQHASTDSPDQSTTTNTARPSSSSSSTAGMSSKLVPANPADVMVIRDLTPNIVTLSLPFARGGQVKIGGRATLVRLSSGTLAVFSPVALTPDVRAKIDALVAAGPGGGAGVDPARKVSHIVAPDFEHHIFLSEWKAAFPGAKLIGPNGLPEKRQRQAAAGADERIRDNEFAVVFPNGPSKRDVRVDPEFDADFDYEFVDAHANKEIVFFYRPDRVLIEADLLFNLPPTEQYQRVPEADRKPGFLDRLFWSANSLEGDLKWARRVQWHLFSRADRPSYNESIARIAAWDFDTLVPCHGETIVGGAKVKFASLFEWHLKAAGASA